MPRTASTSPNRLTRPRTRTAACSCIHVPSDSMSVSPRIAAISDYHGFRRSAMRFAAGGTAGRPRRSIAWSHADRPRRDHDPPRPEGPCCTTTSTAGCAPRRSSSWPARSATEACPTDDADELADVVPRRRRLRLAGALPGDVRAHRRGDADRATGWPGSPARRSRTSPTTASSTPRSAGRPSSTSRPG